MTRDFPPSGQLQLVAQRAHQQAVGRRARPGAAQQLRFGVAHAGDVHRFVAIVPVVRHDPADGGRGARQERAVAHCRDRRGMDVPGVGKHRTLTQQTVQTALVVAPEADQVIVAELVQYDRQNQFRFFWRRTSQAGRGHHAQQDSFHEVTIFQSITQSADTSTLSGVIHVYSTSQLCLSSCCTDRLVQYS